MLLGLTIASAGERELSLIGVNAKAHGMADHRSVSKGMPSWKKSTSRRQ
jgi:hypothetical protein